MKRIFGKIEKICKICKKSFLIHRYRRITALYCCRKCKGIDDRKRMIGNKFSVDRKANSGSFKKGQPSPRGMLGKIAWNRGISAVWIKGKKSHLWKGGITDFRKAERMTFKYKEWRRKVFERDNYTCIDCKKRGVYIEADHIKRWIDYPDLRYELNNGQTLCRLCHLEKMKEEMKGVIAYA